MRKIRIKKRPPVIAIVHGVNTPLGSEWEKDFSWLADGLGAEVIPIKWPSKSFVGDGVRWLTSPKYRLNVVHQIETQLNAISHLDLIVTHSFGQVVMNATQNQMYPRNSCPIINLAGPLSHPLLSLAYGRWSCEHHEQHHVKNRDDQITALLGVSVPVPGAVSTPVDVDVKGDEHPVQHYLENGSVQRLIRNVLRRSKAQREVRRIMGIR